MNKCCTMTRLDNGKYSVLIQSEQGRILYWQRDLSFLEATAAIDKHMGGDDNAQA